MPNTNLSLFDIKAEKIETFRGDYAFLSNFWPAPVWLDDDTYYHVEGAYQAAKTLVQDERTRIRLAKLPGEAKRFGQSVTLRPDWEDVKRGIMWDLLIQKFQDPELRTKLLGTGHKKLIEGNYWHDNYWGMCSCLKHKNKGDNVLGMFLMRLRRELVDAACGTYVLQSFLKDKDEANI